MPRAIWKGVIRLDDIAVPVKLYSAVQDRSVHFRLLHRPDLVPLKQRMVNPRTGEPVEYEDVRRGYEVEEGVYVVLEDDELDELEPEASRDIEITRFVEPAEINHQWYDRPYYLGPDEDGPAYAGLAAALGREAKEGVARWVMRKKEYAGALRAARGGLVLITLRHAGEVVPADALPAPGGRRLGEKEVQMARQLIDALADDFDPARFHDEYRDRVLELIEAKASGKTIPLRRPAEKREAGSLEEVLRKSVQAARERKSA